MSSYTQIEKTEAITTNLTVTSFIPNAHKYNTVQFKSISFLDALGGVIEPATGTVLAFEIPESENFAVKIHWNWKTKEDAEWFDAISVAQLRGNTGDFFSFNAPPDFVGVRFAGIDASVKSVRVRWMAIK